MFQVPREYRHELRIDAAPQTASAWPIIHTARPGSHKRRPRPKAAASVPLAMATVRGAPPRRIGSVSARCSGTSKPSIMRRARHR